MAIDANILIFERIKVEIAKGKKLHDATAIGFKKSWSAIWDSNFTGFIVALILFIF
jgi:preprotein translocase subunit SecD